MFMRKEINITEKYHTHTIIHYENSIIATEFQDGSSESSVHRLSDTLANSGAAGE